MNEELKLAAELAEDAVFLGIVIVSLSRRVVTFHRDVREFQDKYIERKAEKSAEGKIMNSIEEL